jgi:hypothetical protein
MSFRWVEKRTVSSASREKVLPRFRLLGVGAVSAGKSSRLSFAVTTVSPYEDEIADFAKPSRPDAEDETWTEAKNQRRCDLIDRKYMGGLTPAEARELTRLQELMVRHRQRVAPLPYDDALRLYKELLARVGDSRAPTDL